MNYLQRLTLWAVCAGLSTRALTADGPIVINEIHYNPDVPTDLVSFVELHNRSTNAVNLGGWRFSAGIDYTFASGVVLAPSGYLVVAQKPAALTAKYAGTTNVFGPYTNFLSSSGETVTLRDSRGDVQDEVTYKLGFPWPTVGDAPTTNAVDIGKGFSIELIHPDMDNDLGGSWRSSSNGVVRGPTPSRRNTVYATNAPPQIRQVDHSPNQPVAGQPVKITAKVTDPHGVASVTLQYQVVNPGSYIELLDAAYNLPANWTTLTMTDDGAGADIQGGDDTYSAEIPAEIQTHRRLVRYRIQIADNLGASVQVPYADDPCPNFAYFVYNGVPAWRGAIQPGGAGTNGVVMTVSSNEMARLPAYHLIAKKTSVENSTWFTRYAFSEANEPIRSAYQWWGSLVYDGKVYDHIRYRPRGGTWRYAMVKNMWKFDMNRGHDFEARDNYGKKYEVPWSKINFGSSIQQGDFNHRGEQGMFESVGFRLFNLSGVPAVHTTFVSFRIIDEAAESYPNDQYEGDFWGVYLAMEDMGGRYLRQHNLPDGNLYKIDWSSKGFLENVNPNGPTDGSDLAAMRAAWGSASDQWWRTNWNVQGYYSYQATVLAIHHYDINGGKNYYYYRNPENGWWQVLAWDLDLTWAQNMYNTAWGGLTEVTTRILPGASAMAGTGSQSGTSNLQLGGGRPTFEREFRNRVREIRDLLYNDSQAYELIDEYATLLRGTNYPTILDADRNMWDYNPKMNNSTYSTSIGKAGQGRFYQFPNENPSLKGTFAATVQIMKRYVTNRCEYLDTLAFEANIPRQPTLTYTGPGDFPLNKLQFSSSAFFSSNATAFGSIKWRMGEVSDYAMPLHQNFKPRKYEIDAVWETEIPGTFTDAMTIPSQYVEAGRRYRVRVQHIDAAGRASNWSAPVEFVTAPPDNTADLLENLRVTEIMYNPPVGGVEYVELQNRSLNLTLNLTGVRFSQGIDYTFPAGLSVPPGGYVVVANTYDFDGFRAYYNVPANVPVVGPFTSGNLNNAGEQIALATPGETTNIVSFTYGDGRGWPLAADGAGHSLVPQNSGLANQEVTGNYGGNWRASAYLRGSPGRDDPLPAADLILNEIAANTGFGPDSNDWIELYNPTTNSITLSAGWYLSDSLTNLAKWMIPAGTTVPALGWISFDEQTGFHNPTNIGFGIDKDGEQILLSYLPGTPADRIVDSVRFKGQSAGATWGRYPDGSAWWRTLAPATRNAANQLASPQVVISEIHYHPVDVNGTDNNTADEFIEIRNLADQPVALFNTNGPWRLDGEASLVLPPNLTLPPGGVLLVLNFDPYWLPDWEAFTAKFPLPATNLFVTGPFSGTLANSSGRVALEQPQASDVLGSLSWIIMDEVIYADFVPWPCGTDGQGNSLQRVYLTQSGNDPYNWMGQYPTPGFERPPVPAGVASFVTQPATRAVPTNATVSFSVSLCGTPPYTYQWLFNDTPLTGATQAELILTNVQLEASGNYSVIVMNQAGAVTSAVANLYVQFPPAIAAQPLSQVVTGYSTVAFSVAASGTPPFLYQWRFNGTDLYGATNQTLVLPNIQASQAGQYSALVYNTAGSALSTPAALTVHMPAKIALGGQPVDTKTTNTLGAVLSVGAIGDGTLAYQWYFEQAPIIGATSSNLVLTNITMFMDGYYSVRVSNLYGSELSRPARLQVLLVPTWTQNLANQIVTVGADSFFQVGVTGSQPMRLRWTFNNNPIPDYGYERNSDILPLPNIHPGNAGLYRATVTNEIRPGGVSSAIGFLAVVNPPQDAFAVQGSNITLRIQVTGQNVGYQWLFESSPITGATTANLLLTNVSPAQAGRYQVAVRNINITNYYPVNLTVQSAGTAPVILEPPTNRIAMTNRHAVFTVQATGTDPLGFQWYAEGTNLIAGATNTYLVLTNLQASQAGTYQVVVANPFGAVTSAPAMLTVAEPPDISGAPASLAPAASGTLTLSPVVTGTPPFEYQWYFNLTNLLAGQTNASLNLSNLGEAQSGQYYLAVANPVGAATGLVATVTVAAAPAAPLKLETLVAGGGITSASVLFQFGAESNRSYTVQYRDGLGTNTAWLKFLDVAPAPTNRQVGVTNVGSAPVRFFRVATP